MIIETISFILIGIGCALGLIGAIGIITLPDTYARLHAVGGNRYSVYIFNLIRTRLTS